MRLDKQMWLLEKGLSKSSIISLTKDDTFPAYNNRACTQSKKSYVAFLMTYKKCSPGTVATETNNNESKG